MQQLGSRERSERVRRGPKGDRREQRPIFLPGAATRPHRHPDRRRNILGRIAAILRLTLATGDHLPHIRVLATRELRFDRPAIVLEDRPRRIIAGT